MKQKKNWIFIVFFLCLVIGGFQFTRLYYQQVHNRNLQEEAKVEQKKEQIQYQKEKKAENEKITQVYEEINSLLKNQSAAVGVAFYDLSTKESLNLNAKLNFQAQHTIYVPLALVIADKIQAKQLSLDEPIPYDMMGTSSKGVLAKQQKKSYTVEHLLQAMLSDNDAEAYQMLLSLVGGQAALLETLKTGYCAQQPVKGNEVLMNAATAVYYLRWLYENPHQNPVYNQIQEWLLHSGNSGLATKSTRDKMAHRSSLEQENASDIGIYYGEHPYIIAVYTKGDRDGNYIIGEISNKIYEMMEE